MGVHLSAPTPSRPRVSGEYLCLQALCVVSRLPTIPSKPASSSVFLDRNEGAASRLPPRQLAQVPLPSLSTACQFQALLISPFACFLAHPHLHPSLAGPLSPLTQHCHPSDGCPCCLAKSLPVESSLIKPYLCHTPALLVFG